MTGPTRIIAFASVALASLFAALASQSSGAGAEPVAPPAELWSTETTRLLHDYNNRAEVDIRTTKRVVRVTWQHFPNAPSSEGRTEAGHEYDVSFWPTDASGNGLQLLIGGRKSDGRTIIQRWTFAPPSATPTQAQLYDRSSVETLYVGDEEGKRDVVDLAAMPNAPDNLLVLFHDKRELWVFAISTSTWTKVASPDDADVLLVPELSSNWPFFHVRSHASAGVMYTFGHPYQDNTLTFFDAQPYGSIDSHAVLSTSAWNAAGYNEPQNFTPAFPW